MNSNKSETIRLKYKYRDLILRGKIKLPVQAAKKLIGPDCAYHLYSPKGGLKLRKRSDR